MISFDLKESLETVLNLKSDSKPTVLIVDDEENNIQLLKRTFRGKYELLTANNGQQGLDVVKQYGNKISLIISDQKMPVMEGTEFLKQVKEMYPQIIKILLTGHVGTDILVSAINDCDLYQYILKPFELNELAMVVEKGLDKYSMAQSNKIYYFQLKDLFYKTIKSISNALDARDSYTSGHSLRVTLYSMILAKHLDLTQEFMEDIEIASLLHDIGKIAIPKSILCKPSRLTNEEFIIMATHPEKGEKIVININKLHIIANWVKSHHEKYDGTGYPSRLKGEDIPLAGRIIALADTYDAMTSDRPYRKGLPHEVAMSEISRCSGTQFDPKLAEIFVSLSDEIMAAKDTPEEKYKEYSLLNKNVNFTIYSGLTQES